MKTRIALFALALALGGLAFDGAPTGDSLLTEDSAAYCVEIDGQCENPCMDLSRLVYDTTGKPAPWYCPM